LATSRRGADASGGLRAISHGIQLGVQRDRGGSRIILFATLTSSAWGCHYPCCRHWPRIC
jgi:hypothetical protein